MFNSTQPKEIKIEINKKLISPRYSSIKINKKNYLINKKNPTSEIILHEKSDQIEKTSTKFLLGEKINDIDLQILNLVIIDLENRRNRLTEQGLLKESIHVQNAIERARQTQIEISKLEAQKIALLDIKIRKGHSETDKVIINHVQNAKFTNLEIKFENQMKTLLEKHNIEIQNLEKDWTSELKNRRYKQISLTLRNLRDQQEKLIISKRFDEADYVKNQADLLQKEEEQIMIQRRQLDYQNSLEKLLLKQKNEINTLNSAKITKLNVLKKLSEVENETFINRSKAIKFHEDIAKDKDKLWKLKHKNDNQLLMLNKEIISKSKKSKINSSRPEYKSLKLPPLISNKKSIKIV